jgi:hypothetical protein
MKIQTSSTLALMMMWSALTLAHRRENRDWENNDEDWEGDWEDDWENDNQTPPQNNWNPTPKGSCPK